MGHCGARRHARCSGIECVGKEERCPTVKRSCDKDEHPGAGGMPELNPGQYPTEPGSPARRPSRAAYALPALFTSGNIFLGFLSVMQAFEGAMLAHDGTTGAEHHFEIAAKTIGIAVMLDGVDGRIARMTNTTSDFGRELD